MLNDCYCLVRPFPRRGMGLWCAVVRRPRRESNPGDRFSNRMSRGSWLGPPAWTKAGASRDFVRRGSYLVAHPQAEQRSQLATRRRATRVGGDQRRRSNLAQCSQLRLPHRDRLHAALGDAHRAPLANHRHRPRDQLLGLAVDSASHRELPVRRRATGLFLHRDAQEDRPNATPPSVASTGNLRSSISWPTSAT